MDKNVTKNHVLKRMLFKEITTEWICKNKQRKRLHDGTELVEK